MAKIGDEDNSIVIAGMSVATVAGSVHSKFNVKILGQSDHLLINTKENGK